MRKDTRRSHIQIHFDDRLGFGQDGAVWRSSRRTAIKACRLRQAYENERDAYLRLQDRGIYRIGPFDIPRMVDSDDVYATLEMEIVSPPYLLDFGKAYVDRPSPYTEDQIAESMEECRDLFEPADWPAIEGAVLDLKLIGIVYLDVKPANVRPRR